MLPRVPLLRTITESTSDPPFSVVAPNVSTPGDEYSGLAPPAEMGTRMTGRLGSLLEMRRLSL